LEIAHRVSTDPGELAYTALLTLDAERGLSVMDADSFVFDDAPAEAHRAWAGDWPGIRSALLTSTGDADKILLATDTFKLVLVPARSILIAQKFGGNGIRDLLRLADGESVTAMTAWNPVRSNSRFICLVTRTGQVKRFEASLLAGELRQAPYFQLEKKYKSFPACLGAGNEQDQLMLGTNLGRVARIPVLDMGIETFSALRPRKDEQVTAAIFARQQTELIALGQNGQAVYFRPEMIPVAAAGKAGRAWKSLYVAGFAFGKDVQENHAYALTAQGLVHRLAPFNVRKQPRTTQTIVLARDDKVVALFSLAG
jgi:DNA gyrase/topoisomerase IV subunit A